MSISLSIILLCPTEVGIIVHEKQAQLDEAVAQVAMHSESLAREVDELKQELERERKLRIKAERGEQEALEEVDYQNEKTHKFRCKLRLVEDKLEETEAKLDETNAKLKATHDREASGEAEESKHWLAQESKAKRIAELVLQAEAKEVEHEQNKLQKALIELKSTQDNLKDTKAALEVACQKGAKLERIEQELAQENQRLKRAEEASQKAAEQSEAQITTLRDQLQHFQAKLTSTEDELKETKADLMAAREESALKKNTTKAPLGSGQNRIKVSCSAYFRLAEMMGFQDGPPQSLYAELHEALREIGVHLECTTDGRFVLRPKKSEPEMRFMGEGAPEISMVAIFVRNFSSGRWFVARCDMVRVGRLMEEEWGFHIGMLEPECICLRRGSSKECRPLSTPA